MKSGTNYLRKLLQLHPSIFMTEVREPSYFVDPGELKAIWPEMWAHGYWREERNYLQLFASAGEATIVGEASTNYAKIPLRNRRGRTAACLQPGRPPDLSTARPDRAYNEPLLAYGPLS